MDSYSKILRWILTSLPLSELLAINRAAPYFVSGNNIKLFHSLFANCVHVTSASLFKLLNVKISFDQIVANVPWNVTETL